MSDDVRFSEVSYGASLWGLLPLACLAAIVVLAVRRRSALSPATLAWFLPHPLLLAAVGVWYAIGLGAPDPLVLAGFCAACVASGLLVLTREDRAVPAGVALGVASVAGVLALELMWNQKIHTIGPQFWLVELALVAGAVVASWLMGGRRPALVAPVVVALAVVGMLQHYVITFRGTSILPSDLFATSTALSVSGGYTYGLSDTMLMGFLALSLGLMALAHLRPGCRRMPQDLVACAVVVGAMVALVFVPSYGTVFGAQIDYWWSKDWYERQGFLPSFVFAWQDLAVPVPEGYSPQAAQEAQDALAGRELADKDVQARREASTAQFASRMPNIIAIQNETFCDLSTFDGLGNGYQGPAFWREGMPDALARGEFAVSVYGGGTCNTEFEFLTGNSLAFVGTAKYPFTMYDLTVADSMPRQLGELGYRTVGMHPNVASNWNRDRAYEQLGFEEFLCIDDFQGAEEFHTHVSDWATYDKSLSLLRESDEPVFVFDVTMQNHSGYDTGSVPEDMLPGYAIDGLDDEDNGELNEFLACIEQSDRALERLVGSLRELDEPTVVVMYGDHHPWFSEAVNDQLFPAEDPLVHAERIHQTTYVVWANYDVAGGRPSADGNDDTSADLLAAMTLDAMGAPLSGFQQAQLGARHEIRALNADGFLGADGVWHALDEPGTYAQTLHLLELVEYLNFGSKV